MQDIELHEGRLVAALRRLEAAATQLAQPPAPSAPALAPDAAAGAEVARLTGLLDEAREQNVQLTERLATLRDRHQSGLATLEGRITALTGQIDAQGLEMQRLRTVNVQLREAMRALRHGLSAGVSDATQINRALQAEVEALHVTRQIETAELDQLLAALEPLVTPAPGGADA